MNDRYDNFHNREFSYDYPVDFKCHPLDYMIGDQLATYEMNYGDTTCLTFGVEPEYCLHSISIKIYNFRYELLHLFDTTPDSAGKVYLNITPELSNKVFRKGIYYCGILALTYEPIVGSDPVVKTCITIMPPEECSILVK